MNYKFFGTNGIYINRILNGLKNFLVKIILFMSWVRGDIQKRINEIEKSIDEKMKAKNEVEAQLLKIRAELKEIKNELDKQYEALENNPDTVESKAFRDNQPKSKKSKR